MSGALKKSATATSNADLPGSAFSGSRHFFELLPW
jgi:hypothetical protein